MRTRVAVLGVVLLALAAGLHAEDTKKDDKKDGWIELFNGKDTTGWKLRGKDKTSGWTVEKGVLVCSKPGGGNDLLTEKKFTDFELHVEFLSTANSGVYLQGRYEI